MDNLKVAINKMFLNSYFVHAIQSYKEDCGFGQFPNN